MKNIELKAEFPDLGFGENTAVKVGAEFQWRRQQTDTYFQVKEGRLKIREIEAGDAELISYFRPNEKDLRTSHFRRLPLLDPGALREVLSQHWGILVTVTKIRSLYLLHNVRIHLDQVFGLGNFLEFEGMISEESEIAETESRLRKLKREFAIQDAQLIATSYSDLLGKKRDVK